MAQRIEDWAKRLDRIEAIFPSVSARKKLHPIERLTEPEVRETLVRWLCELMLSAERADWQPTIRDSHLAVWLHIVGSQIDNGANHMSMAELRAMSRGWMPWPD